MHRHELTDQEWKRIRPLLPPRRGRHSLKGERLFVSAVYWLARTGSPWRDLPGRYGKWKSVHNRFNNWSKRGVWERLFKEVQVESNPPVPRDEASILDGTTIRAHLDAAGGKGGSNTTLWDALEEVFRPRSMPSSTAEVGHATSS
ncbi:IS5 family transposase [Corallococcus sp. CA054B]|nr:IS5 family transposase [Corallococcus sp. CA054B]